MSVETKVKSKKVTTTEIKDQISLSKQDHDAWITQLYDHNKITDDDLRAMYEALRYKGFDRSLIIDQLKAVTLGNSKLATEIIILCALQGPQRASKTKLSNGSSPSEMGIPASGQQGTTKISCQRITAATADLAALYLKRLDVPKRIISSALPGWLQFPSAGSIKLPKELRDQHLDFSKAFSQLIGGNFREDIYTQMMSNAYLDANIKLFE
jgi:hypothetical protein